jgi:hypothetical protein
MGFFHPRLLDLAWPLEVVANDGPDNPEGEVPL